jgi:hypothetical protein
MHPFAFLGFSTETLYYWYRVGFSYWFMLFVFYSFIMCLLVSGLLRYHTYLIRNNLTTNEEINILKYDYLQNQGKYSNPFSLYPCDNIAEVIVPLQTVYYQREEVLRDRSRLITL